MLSVFTQFQLCSRETLVLSNNILLTVAMVAILLDTLYPLIIDSLGIGKISVGAPYFNTIFIPIVILLLIFMGVLPLLSGAEQSLKKSLKNYY